MRGEGGVSGRCDSGSGLGQHWRLQVDFPQLGDGGL
jgi:hypothetical protein